MCKKKYQKPFTNNCYGCNSFLTENKWWISGYDKTKRLPVAYCRDCYEKNKKIN